MLVGASRADSAEMEIPEDTPSDSPDSQAIVLVEQVVEMLYKREPRWREGPKPNRFEMERLVEDARFVLSAVDNHLHRRVHAYQLFFPQGSMMTAREIEARFREVGWLKGKGHNTLRKDLRELLGHAEKEVSARRETFAGIMTESGPTAGGRLSVAELLEQLEGEIIMLLDRVGIAAAVTDPEDLSRAVVASIVKLVEAQLHRSSTKFMAEDPTVSLATGYFMRYVCDADTLEEFEARGEQPVRPYELFLFAHQQGLLEEKLTIAVKNLTPGAENEIGEAYRTSLSILETHGGVEEAISTWISKNDPQDVAPLDARFPDENGAGDASP